MGTRRARGVLLAPRTPAARRRRGSRARAGETRNGRRGPRRRGREVPPRRRLPLRHGGCMAVPRTRGSGGAPIKTGRGPPGGAGWWSSRSTTGWTPSATPVRMTSSPFLRVRGSRSVRSRPALDRVRDQRGCPQGGPVQRHPLLGVRRWSGNQAPVRLTAACGLCHAAPPSCPRPSPDHGGGRRTPPGSAVVGPRASATWASSCA
jgi:hypothetical protein